MSSLASAEKREGEALAVSQALKGEKADVVSKTELEQVKANLQVDAVKPTVSTSLIIFLTCLQGQNRRSTYGSGTDG